MMTELELADYRNEIRAQVCRRCIERPPGGPPCAPLGKNCGVEMHLDKLIESIHEVSSPFLEPYQEHDRREICEKCIFLHSSICPCPMDYLAALVVQAVEAVDERHRRDQESPVPRKANLQAAHCAVANATGQLTNCEWPKKFDIGG